ncbi:MAG: stage II sporulation protein P, partial [Christensenellales bacterium]
MARFKVIKGGTLLVAVSIIILVAVIAFIAISYYMGRSVSTGASTGAEVVEAFAPEGAALALDPDAHPPENEHTDDVVSIQSEVIRDIAPVANGKRVLIYHTHTHEAYEPRYPDEYDAIETWRTEDHAHSIVRVGAELAALLEAQGFT